MAEKEYIERDAAIKAVEIVDFYKGSGIVPSGYASDAIRTIPAADVRPVVLCKDCVHSVKGKKSLECEKHRYVWNNMNRWVNDEDFCCWGAKREA